MRFQKSFIINLSSKFIYFIFNLQFFGYSYFTYNLWITTNLKNTFDFHYSRKTELLYEQNRRAVFLFLAHLQNK